VLPFVNMSDDPANEYFSDGLSEELLNVLTRADELRVAARTSAFSFKGRDVDVREIGEALGVDAVVEGSVRKSGDRVRITAQLVKTSDGFHMWSQTYDRELTDIFAVQDEIAASIADALQVTLFEEKADRTARGGTSDLEAFDLYLLGRHRLATRSADGIRAAIGYFEAAAMRDPEFAIACSGIADAWAVLPWYERIDPAEAATRAKAAALRAVELRPDLAEAQSALAHVTFLYDWDWGSAIARFRRAIELNANYAAARLWYSGPLAMTGAAKESVRQLEIALRLDPLSTITLFLYSERLYELGEVEKSFELSERVLAMETTPSIAFYFGAINRAAEGSYERAAELLERWAELEELPEPSALGGVIHAARDSTLLPGAVAVLENIESNSALRRTDLLSLYAVIGAVEETIQGMELAVQTKHPMAVWLGSMSGPERLLTDPRYLAILEEMNLSITPFDPPE
jgi:serine/threonine-protein kinase